MSTRIVLAVLIGLLAAGVLVLRPAGDASTGFVFPDAYHYAEMGRQLARGEGFSSLQAYPYSLAWMQHAGIAPEPPWPNVTRFPLITMLYAPVFRMIGASDFAIYLVGELFFVLTASATFLLGARLFGAGVGVAAAAVFAVSLTQIGLARSGLLETPAAFCIVLATLGVAGTLAGSGRAASLRAVLLGLLLGVAFLLRYDLLALAVAAVVVLACGRGIAGARQAAWVLLGCAVPVGLWVVRNQLALGEPFVFLGLDRNVLATVRLTDPYASPAYESVWSVLRRQPEIVTGKVATVLWPLQHWWQLFGWKYGWLGPLFLASSAFLLATRHRARGPCVFLVVAFLARVAILSATHHEHRFYASFVPAVLVFSFGGAWAALVTALPGRRVLRAAIVVAVAALLSDGARSQHGPREIRNARRRMAPVDETYDAIRRRTPAGAVIATIDSEGVGWHADRPAVRVDPARIVEIEALGVHIDGLLYRTSAHVDVQRALRQQGLSEEFVPVRIGEHLTFWLREALVSGWHERGHGGDAMGGNQAG